MSQVSTDSTPNAGASGHGPPAPMPPAALLDHLPVGILYQNASGAIAYVNRTACQFFNLPAPEQLIDQPLHEALPELQPHAGGETIRLTSGLPSSDVWRTDSGVVVEVTRHPLAVGEGVIWQFRKLDTEPLASPAEAARAVLLVIGRDGTLLKAEGRIGGLQPAVFERYVGLPLETLFVDLGITDPHDLVKAALGGGEVRVTFSYQGEAYAVDLSPLSEDGKTADVIGIVRDAAPRHHEEALLRQHKAYFEALRLTTLDLVNRLDLDDLLQSIVLRSAALTGTAHGYLYLVEPDESAIKVRYGTGVFDDHLGFCMQRGEGAAGRVWATGTTLVVEDYATWTGRSDAWDRDVIHAVVCVPLHIDAQVVGVIGVANVGSTRQFNNEEIQLLSHLAELASLALANARLYQSAQDDIGERKRTEAALRASEARYRSVVTAMGEGIVVLDASGKMIDANRAAARILRIPREELLSQDIVLFEERLTHADGSLFAASEYPATVTLATGVPQNDVLMGVHHDDGSLTWLSVNSQPILDADGNPRTVVVSFSNVTEYKRVQAELQRRIDTLAALQKVDVELSKSLDMDVVLDAALQVTTAACEAEGGFIVLLEDGKPSTVRESDPSEGLAAQALADWQRSGIWTELLTARQPVELEGDPALVVLPLGPVATRTGLLVLRCAPSQAGQESLSFYELVGARIAMALENARLFQVSQRQLAELKDVYDQLQRLEQLKTQMIRVAAHDLRSPLGVIGGYVSMLQSDLGENAAPYETFFEEIFRAVARMEQMTTDILSLERIHATHDNNYEILMLDALVERAFIDCHYLVSTKPLRYDLVRAANPLPVRGDPVQLYEAVENLISNAIKYTPQDGQVTVRVYCDDHYAGVEVIDTGLGVPEEAKPVLFEPFFRVKTEETLHIDGTGLGLYLVKSIVEAHRGRMRFESELGRGSVFGFELPLVSPDA